MFRKLFSRSRSVRDVDTLIRDVADHQKPADYAEFFAVLPALSLFLSIVGGLPSNLPPGQAFRVAAGADIEAGTATVQGLTCVLLYTSASELGNEYAEINGKEALNMVLRMPGISGILVQSTGTGWVVLDRAKILYVLAAADRN